MFFLNTAELKNVVVVVEVVVMKEVEQEIVMLGCKHADTPWLGAFNDRRSTLCYFVFIG